MLPRRRQVLPATGENTLQNLDTSNASNVAEETAGDEDVQGSFLFIASTGQKSSAKDREQLKSLRAHVMHNYLDRVNAKQESESTTAGHNEGENVNSKVKTNVDRGQKMRFRLTSDGLEQRHPHRRGKRKGRSVAVGGEPAPQAQLSRLSAHRIDPFDTLPLQLDASDEILLNRFRTIERWPWCPINGQGLWPRFALSDRLVFHVTMYSFSMHFRGRTGASLVIAPTEPDEELRIIQHKLAAISLVNERLSSEADAISDECIAAVATLTNIALVLDSHEEAKKHMQGLQAVINMRGGLLSLGRGVQQHLQRLISFNDFMYSELFDEQMRFPPLSQLWEEAWSKLDEPAISASLPGLGRADLMVVGLAPHPVLEVLEDIRQLCYSEQIKPLSQADDSARMIRGDVCLLLERRLRLIIQSTIPPTPNPWDGIIWRAVALAALIYVHHILRGNPLRYRHFKILSTQLCDTLLTMEDDQPELDFAPAMATWVLSIGAITSPLPIVRAEFVTMLRKACIRFGLVNWHTFRWTVAGFLWTGQTDEERYFPLWQELEASLHEPGDLIRT